MTYREAERPRQAEYVMKNQCQYTDAEIRKAKAIVGKVLAVRLTHRSYSQGRA